MKIISEQKRSLVYFNEEEDTFIKIFKPKFLNILKYLFRFRKYPGNNFFYISKELKKLEIKTLEILSYSHYKVITKNIHGVPLNIYLEKNRDNNEIIQKYISLVTKLLKNNIYSGDLSFDNFFVKNDEIIVIDLEDYRKVKFFKRDRKEAIRRLYGKINEDIIEKIENNLKILA